MRQEQIYQARPMRSVLFVPGNRPQMLKKARALPADALILDLEDGVPLGEKERARSIVQMAIADGGYTSGVVLRINGFRTGLAEADLQETFAVGVDFVCLPKAETAADVERLALQLTILERAYHLRVGVIGVMLMVETALGVLNAHIMARASRRVRALCLGGEDLAHDLGAVRSKEGPELAYARSHLVLAARAARVHALDTVFTDLTDGEGLVAEAEQARRLGYSGKLLIHPTQIQAVNRAFTPSEEEMGYARRVVRAFEMAEAQGQGVVALDGQMIDAPVVARAREVLALARARPQ